MGCWRLGGKSLESPILTLAWNCPSSASPQPLLWPSLSHCRQWHAAPQIAQLTLAPPPPLPNQILLCGYYGEHNLGDDALLAVLLQQLPASCQPLVTARDQRLVQQRFGVATTDRGSLSGVLRALGDCRALVLGGGSLLQDSTSFKSLLYYAALILAARLQGKPVGLWGQGLGPLRRRRSRCLVRSLLPLATAISWRDPASTALAAGWGIQALQGSDPVWGFQPRAWHGEGGPILVCWRPTPLLVGQAWTPYLAALDRLASRSDRPVHWLPFHHDQDGPLLQSLRSQGLLPPDLEARSQLVAAGDPAAALDHCAGASLVIAMRLHGLILAALAGAPTAALSYDPKVAAAAAAIGCPCHDLASPGDPDLAERWQQQLDQPTPTDRIAALRAGAGRHRLVLEQVVTAAGLQPGPPSGQA